jgi:hypothetical protein
VVRNSPRASASGGASRRADRAAYGKAQGEAVSRNPLPQHAHTTEARRSITAGSTRTWKGGEKSALMMQEPKCWPARLHGSQSMAIAAATGLSTFIHHIRQLNGSKGATLSV